MKIHFKNIKIITFTSIELLKNKLLETKFESVFILISGYFFKDFLLLMKELENKLYCYPIIILFTSDKVKRVLISKRKDPIIQFDNFTFEKINDPFYNAGGIFTDFEALYNYLASFKKNLYLEINEDSDKFTNDLDYTKAICFQKIDSEKDLILPLLYKDLESNDKITSDEIDNFHKFISTNHFSKDIKKLFYPLLNINKNKDNKKLLISLSILSKFWAKLYSFEYPFYKSLNNYLMNNETEKLKNYHIFIKMMYKGLDLESLLPDSKNTIYRGCILNFEEIKNLEKYQNYNRNNYPKVLLYSRCFLSFSKNRKIAENFIIDYYYKIINNENRNTLTQVLFIIEGLNKIIKYLSNCDMEKISDFRKEREILFFPYSSFIVEDIKKSTIKDFKTNIEIPIREITLSYLGKYKKVILNEIKNIKDIKQFINKEKEKKTNKFIKSYIHQKIDFFKLQNNMEKTMEKNMEKDIEKNLENQIIENIEKVIIENNPQKKIIKQKIENLDKNKNYYLICNYCSKIHFDNKVYKCKYDENQWKILKWDYKIRNAIKIIENWKEDNNQEIYNHGCISKCKQSLGKKWYEYLEI